MEALTYEQAIENIKGLGKKEKQTIEIAEEIAAVINTITLERIISGMSQAELAEKVGCTQTTIANIESIKIVPRLDQLIKIARFLDIQLIINPKQQQ